MKKDVLLTFGLEFYKELEKKAKKQKFRNVEDFLYYIIRRNMYYGKAGKKLKNSDITYLDKFSVPTKETRRIERSIIPR